MLSPPPLMLTDFTCEVPALQPPLFSHRLRADQSGQSGQSGQAGKQLHVGLESPLVSYPSIATLNDEEGIV